MDTSIIILIIYALIGFYFIFEKELNPKKKKEEIIKINRALLNKYDEEGYYRERLDRSKIEWTIFSKDFEISESVIYLGEDGVGGDYYYGEEYISNSEMVKNKDDLNSHFWKKIDVLNFE